MVRTRTLPRTGRHKPLLGCRDNPIELGSDDEGHVPSDVDDDETIVEDDKSGNSDDDAEEESHENGALLILPELDFMRIPDALLAPAASQRARRFWTHELYWHRITGERVKLVYCNTYAQSEAAASRLWNHERLLGFDMEWKPSYVRGKSQTANSGFLTARDIKNNASVVQLACASEIVIFHIAAHGGSTAQELVAPSLRKILESPAITKTGVAILTADAPRLRRYLGVKPRGLFELGHFHRALLEAQRKLQPDQEHTAPLRPVTGLAKLVQEYCGLPLSKGKVRTSNWHRDGALSPEQLTYAGADAYAGYILFRVMEQKRHDFNPCVQIPDHTDFSNKKNSKQCAQGENEKNKPMVRTVDVAIPTKESELDSRNTIEDAPPAGDMCQSFDKPESQLPASLLSPLKQRIYHPNPNYSPAHQDHEVDKRQPSLSPQKENVQSQKAEMASQKYPSFCSSVPVVEIEPQPSARKTMAPNDRPSRQVLSALRGLVIRLGLRYNCRPEDVVPFARLVEMAIKRPTSMEEMHLGTLTQYSELFSLCKRQSIDIFAYIKRYTPTEYPTEAVSDARPLPIGVHSTAHEPKGRSPLKSLNVQT